MPQGTPARLFGPALLTAATATKYTVPALNTALIRHIHVQNNEAVAHTLTISLGADAAGTRLYDAYPMAANAVLDWYPYLVLQAAELIAAFADTTLKLNMTIMGDVWITG